MLLISSSWENLLAVSFCLGFHSSSAQADFGVSLPGCAWCHWWLQPFKEVLIRRWKKKSKRFCGNAKEIFHFISFLKNFSRNLAGWARLLPSVSKTYPSDMGSEVYRGILQKTDVAVKALRPWIFTEIDSFWSFWSYCPVLFHLKSTRSYYISSKEREAVTDCENFAEEVRILTGVRTTLGWQRGASPWLVATSRREVLHLRAPKRLRRSSLLFGSSKSSREL